MLILTQGDFNKLLNDIKNSWNDLGGNNVIDSFEENWCHWNINDTIKWFKFTLSGKGLDFQDDYKIEHYCSGSSDDENEDENQELEIDFKLVETNLTSINFNASKYFPVLLKSFQFKQFGFKNKKDQKYLCKKVKLLVEKYPKNKKKSNKERINDNVNHSQLEGFVQDTH